MRRRSSLRSWPRLLLPFGALPAGPYGGTLPGGLTYGLATSGTTCRTSASTLLTGIAANTPRIEVVQTVAGLKQGLLLEPSITNTSPQGQDASLFTQAGTGASYGGTIAGPDGSTLARAVTVSSGGNSKFQNVPLAAASLGVTFSAWCQAVSGTARVQPTFSPSNAGITTAYGAAVSTTWERIAASTAFSPALAPSTTTVFPMIGTDESGTPFGDTAQDHGPAYMGFMQVEQLGFPTSWIAPGVTRAGTTLSLPSLAAVASNGRLAFEVGFVPLGSNNVAAFQVPGIGYNVRFWTSAVDPTTYLELDGATGLLRASVAGSTTLSDAPLLWSPTDYVQIYVEAGHGPSVVYVTTNGVGATYAGQSQASLPAIPDVALAGALALGYDPSTGLQLPAVVDYFAFW